MSFARNSRTRFEGSRTVVLLTMLTVSIGGCSPRGSGGSQSSGSSTEQSDVVQTAANDAPANERLYLVAAKPVLKAIVARDYVKFHDMLSSHAKASSNPHQYVAPQEENPQPQPDLKDLTVEQFVEWMKKMEAARGYPIRLNDVHVESIDPKILSGQAEGLDRMSVMFAIGAMPKDIPNEIRRASIRAQVQCSLSDEQVKLLARQNNTTEEAVRKDEAEEEDEDRGTYFNLKFVFVEEEGKLKVGYFEIMPPSMWD